MMVSLDDQCDWIGRHLGDLNVPNKGDVSKFSEAGRSQGL